MEPKFLQAGLFTRVSSYIVSSYIVSSAYCLISCLSHIVSIIMSRRCVEVKFNGVRLA